MKHQSLFLQVFGFLSLSLFNSVFSQSLDEGKFGTYFFQVLYLNDQVEYTDDGLVIPGISLSFQTEEETYKISAVRNGLSRVFKYVGPPEIIFFQEDSSSGGEVAKRPLVKAALGKPGDKILIVGKSSSGRLVSRTLDFNRAGFAGNSFRIINLSNQTILAVVDEERHKLEGMSLYDFQLEDNGKSRFLVPVSIAAIYDGNPYLVDKRRISSRRDGRKIIIVHNDVANPTKLTYKTFTINYRDEVTNVSDKEFKNIDTRKYYDIFDGGE
ncbi:MAG: hypothetical protein AAGJ81_06760 [Verrucomicrobiota bacterium]